MSLHHYGAMKAAAWVSGALSAAIFAFVAEAQDLSNNAVKIALISAITSLLIAVVTGATTITLQLLSRRDVAKMQTSIDGHFGTLLAKSEQQSTELVDKTDKLAHAEGRREGVEASEDKTKGV
jgi:lysine/ornithine N-monooxygenase